MKIIHVVTGLDAGGAENALLNLSIAHARSGMDVRVISLKAPGMVGRQLTEAGIPVRSLGLTSGAWGVAGLFQLGAWIRNEHAEIIQTWMYHANLLGGLAARFWCRTPVVWGIHHLLSEDGGLLGPRTLRIARVSAALSHLLPARIVCCGPAARASHFRAGYSDKKMLTIPNGVDMHRFRPDPGARRSMRAELGLDSATPLIGMFARYHPAKDHAAFIEAAAMLHGRIPSAHYVLSGDGVELANRELAARIEAAQLTPYFHLLGRRTDMPRLYNGLDIAALSSRTEAFPSVIVEAMACGIPCAAVDIGDCAYIIQDAGRVVPAGDSRALSAAWLDILQMKSPDYASLGTRARQRVLSNFALENSAHMYLDLYDRLAGGSPTRPAPRNPI